MRSGTSSRLLAIAPSGRRWVIVLVAILLLTTVTYVGQGLLIARALSSVLGGASLDSLVAPVLGVVGLQVVRAVLAVGRAEAALRASSLVKEAVRQALVRRLLELGPGWMQGTRSGSLQSTLVDGVETTEAYFGRFLPQAVAAVIGAGGVTA